MFRQVCDVYECNKSETIQIHFFYLYYFCVRMNPICWAFFFHFEIPKRHIATFWNCSAIHIHTTHVLLLLASSRWSAGRNLCTFPTVCFSFNSFCFGLFVITSKKYEMYSSEMVGFSPFWRKLLAPLWKEMSEGVRRTSIYTETELSNAKQQRKRKNPPCDERKLWSFIFEIIHGCRVWVREPMRWCLKM